MPRWPRPRRECGWCLTPRPEAQPWSEPANASTIILAYPPHDGDDMDTAALDTLTKAANTAARGLTVHGTSLKALASGTTSTGGNSTRVRRAAGRRAWVR